MPRLIKYHPGTVKNGRREYWNPDRQRENLLLLEGKDFIETIERMTKQRSLPQNKYYRGVVIPMVADETGYSDDQAHEAMKLMFLYVPGEGKKPPTIGSTTDESIISFEEYLQKIREWAFDFLNLVIPLPNEARLPEKHF